MERVMKRTEPENGSSLISDERDVDEYHLRNVKAGRLRFTSNKLVAKGDTDPSMTISDTVLIDYSGAQNQFVERFDISIDETLKDELIVSLLKLTEGEQVKLILGVLPEAAKVVYRRLMVEQENTPLRDGATQPLPSATKLNILLDKLTTEQLEALNELVQHNNADNRNIFGF